jgi:hypothetical protein
MFGLRFLLQLVMQAYNLFVGAHTTKRDAIVRDDFLKSKFDMIQQQLIRNFNEVMPDTDHQNSIRVIALMPTVSLESRLEGREEKDACVIFCENNMLSAHVDELFNEHINHWFRMAGVCGVLTFTEITNPDYYQLFHEFTQSEWAKAFSPDVIELIADEFGTYYATKIMAVWSMPGERPDWLMDGLNTRSDSVLWFDDVVDRFNNDSNVMLQQKLKARESE